MIIVAGHVCLDIIPRFESRATLDPGTLVRVGAATLSTGGVSNVGVALHRLGVPVKLIHKVGDDLFGDAIKSILSRLSPELASGIRTIPGETTSYSVVVAPPGVDRMFIHCPGANDTFADGDVTAAALGGAKHLHFGYPPIMKALLVEGGERCAALLARSRDAGLTTSLDLCSIDPQSVAGKIDWAAWLTKVLPRVAIFTPSYDELAIALNAPAEVTPANVRTLARRCVDMGAGSVLIKLGEHGIYSLDSGVEQHHPCFKVDVVSTNGAGDCTVAGYLVARVLKGWDNPLRFACAVGACCCEAPDATSGVKPLAETEGRLARGWKTLETPFA